MADLEAVARALLRGGRSLAEATRAEAERVLAELVARGELGREEAAEIEAAVGQAAETHERWLDERVLAPLRSAWRSAATSVGRAVAGAEDAPARDELRERLGAIEARLDRIERALAGRSASGRED